MVFLVMSLLLILFLAWVVDFLLTEKEIRKWRNATREFRARFSDLDIFEATEASNLWFLGLFKAIYGERFFSRRRIVASALSTILAMVLVAYIFETVDMPGFHVLYWGILSAMLILTPINFVADYLSLQETFWVLKKSQGRKFLGIFFLTIVDIVLTSLIYMGTVLVIGYALIQNEFFLDLLDDLLGEPRFDFVDQDTGVAMFFGILAASTYVTSLLWIGFVSSSIGVRLLQAASPALQKIIKLIGASERPAFAVGGFICATTTLFYGGIRTVFWVFSLAL
jgi:hypothetical protein